MDWKNWVQDIGTSLVDGGVKYATNNQQIKANNAADLLQLQQVQMQAYNNWGQPYIEGQPVQSGSIAGIPTGMLLIGAVVLVVVMVKS